MYLFTNSKTALKEAVMRTSERVWAYELLAGDWRRLDLLWDRIPAADRKTLQLVRVGEENTTIAEWDIERAVQARYSADIETLRRFLSDAEGEKMDVIQKIRPVSRRVLPQSVSNAVRRTGNDGRHFRIVRDAGASHPLHPVVEDLDDLNIYCRRYHHAENPNAASEPIDDAELLGYVKKTLKLVGSLL